MIIGLGSRYELNFLHRQFPTVMVNILTSKYNETKEIRVRYVPYIQENS